MEDLYLELAKKALKIMEIKFTEEDTLETLIPKIRYAIRLPGSNTEGEIMLLSRQIADALETKGSVESINELLEKLHSEVTFLYFD
jgi:hypothetical protein